MKEFVKDYWKTVVGYGFLIFTGSLVLFFITTSAWIGMSVKDQCIAAREQYEGSCVEALIDYVRDEQGHNLRERNRAVWALGQLGDPRALPVLRSYYTGEECDHGQFLCQWELEKAIDLAGGGFNATAWVWRRDIK